MSAKPGNVTVVPEKSIYTINNTLNCSAVGSEILTYTWLVTTNGKTIVVTDSTLIVNSSYAGPVQIICLVRNDYGTARTEVNAIVFGKFNKQHGIDGN